MQTEPREKTQVQPQLTNGLTLSQQVGVSPLLPVSEEWVTLQLYNPVLSFIYLFFFYIGEWNSMAKSTGTARNKAKKKAAKKVYTEDRTNLSNPEVNAWIQSTMPGRRSAAVKGMRRMGYKKL